MSRLVFSLLFCLFTVPLISSSLPSSNLYAPSPSSSSSSSSVCTVHDGNCDECARAGCVFCVDTSHHGSLESSGVCQTPSPSCPLYVPYPPLGRTCHDIQSPHMLMQLRETERNAQQHLRTDDSNMRTDDSNMRTDDSNMRTDDSNMRTDAHRPRSPISVAQPVLLGVGVGVLVLVVVVSCLCCNPKKMCCCCR
eukprot:GHVS01022509.1.p1 GENE.GHVS01022509.1~~GHVS01022509.1.p1  ORF type:complete len:194 (+),score=48.11 GHVS01022509.1:19-600(+)